VRYWLPFVLMLFILFATTVKVNSTPYAAEGCTMVSYEDIELPSGCHLVTLTMHCEFPAFNVSTSCAFTFCDYGDYGTMSGQCKSFTY